MAGPTSAALSAIVPTLIYKQNVIDEAHRIDGSIVAQRTPQKTGVGPHGQTVTPIAPPPAAPAPSVHAEEKVDMFDQDNFVDQAVSAEQGSTLESTWEGAKKSIKKVLSIALIVAGICLTIFGAIAIAGIIAFHAGCLACFAAVIVAPVITAVGTPLTCIFASIIGVGGLALSTYSIQAVLKKKIIDEAAQDDDNASSIADEDAQPGVDEGVPPPPPVDAVEPPINSSLESASGPAVSAESAQQSEKPVPIAAASAALPIAATKNSPAPALRTLEAGAASSAT